MKIRTISERRWFIAALGSVLTVLCGLAIWKMPAGEGWVNASYDYLFRFGARPSTNELVLVLMDNEARDILQQDAQWDRQLHADLLARLDGCPLVVFDVFFEEQRQTDSDRALADAMRRQGHVVLAQDAGQPVHSRFEGVAVVPLYHLFSEATTNWGIARASVDSGQIARRHWPFPAPVPGFPSLAWTAAQQTGAILNEAPSEQWLRYYGPDGAWEAFSYHLALSNSPAYYTNKIVFVGNKPITDRPGAFEEDKYSTPYTRWTEKTVGGVEILATQYLNLMKGDWLRRPAWWIELLLLIGTGALLGFGLFFVRPWPAALLAGGAAAAVSVGAVCLSYYTNYWFPWLIVVGGQIPCALVWTVTLRRILKREATQVISMVELEPTDFERFGPPFGEGAFGKVWIVRNAIGQWQALKEIYKEKFDGDAAKYEMEFNGIQKYKPISHKHPGLLRVEFVSRERRGGYFYYVMELGDSSSLDWEQNPALYQPCDLASLCARSEGKRLPVQQCLSIGSKLADALEFLHQEGLTHRDIKPRNIIFVNGEPKLGDVGTVTDLRDPDQIRTLVGSPGYLPPPPETPGTRQADIYSLGMVLYAISTGRHPVHDFPLLSTTLMESVQFHRLNEIIAKACHPDLARRYALAAELGKDLADAFESNQAIGKF